MRPGHQDINVNFLLHLGHVAHMGDRHLSTIRGRQAPIFENFPIRHIFLKFCFFNIKMKKKGFLPARNKQDSRGVEKEH